MDGVADAPASVAALRLCRFEVPGGVRCVREVEEDEFADTWDRVDADDVPDSIASIGRAVRAIDSTTRIQREWSQHDGLGYAEVVLCNER